MMARNNAGPAVQGTASSSQASTGGATLVPFRYDPRQNAYYLGKVRLSSRDTRSIFEGGLERQLRDYGYPAGVMSAGAYLQRTLGDPDPRYLEQYSRTFQGYESRAQAGTGAADPDAGRGAGGGDAGSGPATQPGETGGAGTGGATKPGTEKPGSAGEAAGSDPAGGGIADLAHTTFDVVAGSLALNSLFRRGGGSPPVAPPVRKLPAPRKPGKLPPALRKPLAPAAPSSLSAWGRFKSGVGSAATKVGNGLKAAGTGIANGLSKVGAGLASGAKRIGGPVVRAGGVVLRAVPKHPLLALGIGLATIGGGWLLGRSGGGDAPTPGPVTAVRDAGTGSGSGTVSPDPAPTGGSSTSSGVEILGAPADAVDLGD